MTNVSVWPMKDGESIVLLIRGYDPKMRRDVTQALKVTKDDARKLADEIKRMA